jgi:hypothetical protein
LRRKLVPTLFQLRSLRRRVRNQKQGQAQEEASRQAAMHSARPELSTSVSPESLPFQPGDAHDDLPKAQ